MSIICTVLIQLALATVHGVIPAGTQLEFLAPGSPDRQVARSDARGAYSIALAAGRYEVTLIAVSGKRTTAMVSITATGAEINAQAEEKSKVAPSAQEYDLLADWRVVEKNADKTKHGVGPVKVALEAELSNGRTEKLSVWALSGNGDEEKETDGAFETTPDGRVLFRVRESRFRPDRVVALHVKVEAPGHAPFEQRLLPVLEFSASGHFHAIYPEQYEMILP